MTKARSKHAARNEVIINTQKALNQMENNTGIKHNKTMTSWTTSA
jgi:hypothetical protein